MPDALRLEEVPCPFCGCSLRRMVLAARDHIYGVSGEFRITSCLECGTHYTCPRPVPEDIAKAYPQVYASGYRHNTSFQHSAAFKQRLVLLKSLRPSGRLLEVGCAAGHFLALARSAGYDVAGVEIDRRTAIYAREHYGLEVQVSSVETAQLSENSFDLQCLFDVLEHTVEPRRCLKVIFRALRPGGTLIVTVPNYGCVESRFWGEFWYGLDLPRHLVHFSSLTLRKVLLEAGFSEIEIKHQSEPNYGAQSLIKWVNYALGRKPGSSRAQEPEGQSVNQGEHGRRETIYRTLCALNAVPSFLLSKINQGSTMLAVATKR